MGKILKNKDNIKNNIQIGILVLVLISFLVLIPVLFNFLFKTYYEKNINTVEDTTGIVTNYETISNVSGFIVVSTQIERNVYFTYEVNGQKYSGKAIVDRPYEKGEVINIKYNPDNPNIVNISK